VVRMAMWMETLGALFILQAPSIPDGSVGGGRPALGRLDLEHLDPSTCSPVCDEGPGGSGFMFICMGLGGSGERDGR